MLPRFTPAFFQPITARPATPPASAGTSGAVPVVPARQPVVYSAARYQSMEHFLVHSDFATFQTEFEALIDRLPRFAETHAKTVKPPLSDAALTQLESDCDLLKEHLFIQEVNFFSDHKVKVYGNGKELFQTFNRLLGDDKIGVQQRLNALLELSPKLTVCAGGLLTELQSAITQLRLSTVGIRGPAYRMKVQMTKQLILQHVEAHHIYPSGDETHFVTAYFNYLATQMGLPEETDPLVTIAVAEITPELLEQCRASVLARMTPTRLAHAMGDAYLDQIVGAAESTGIALTGPTPLAEAWMATKGIDTVKEAMLDPEYGKVDQKLYVRTVPNPDDAEPDDYQLARNSVLLAEHFVTRMRDEKLVEFDNAFTLKANAHDGADLMQLGHLFWLRRKDRSCDAIKTSHLLAVSPQDVLNNPEIAPNARYAVLQGIAGHVLEASDVEGLDKGNVPQAWLMQFAEIFNLQQQEQPEGAQDWIVPVLMLAARHDAGQVLDTLAQAKADMEARDLDGKTALMAAAETGSTTALMALLQAGANKEQQDTQGNTALLIAAENCECFVLNHLINCGANLDHFNAQGDTATIIAAENNDVRSLNLLNNARANLDHANKAGNTAVMFAAWEGHTEALEILLDAGASITGTNADGNTAVMLAAMEGHAEALEILLDAGASITGINADGKSLFMLATEQELAHVVTEAVNAVDDKGNTATIYATLHGDVHTLEALIAAGADLDHANDAGKTAVIIAAARGYLAVMNVLIGAGADPDIADASGNTALMFAAAFDRLPVVLALIGNDRLNLNARNQKGATAILLAAEKGHVDVLRALIAAGANLQEQNQRGETAMEVAAKNGHAGAVEVLRQATTGPDAE